MVSRKFGDNPHLVGRSKTKGGKFWQEGATGGTKFWVNKVLKLIVVTL